MNVTERKGYAWLLSKGYEPKDIVFQRHRSPDFRTSDGKGYEIKLKRGNIILFSESQLKTLKNLKDITVVVFNKENDSPLTTFSNSNLERNAIIDGTGIYVFPHSQHSINEPFDDNEFERLTKIKEKHGYKSWRKFISDAATALDGIR